MARKSPPRAPRLRRRHGRRELLPRVLVVCEGKTEKRCLDGLRAAWRLPSIQVVVIGEGGDPRAVVERARTRAVEVRRSCGRGARVQVWVAFDRDDHAHWAAALDRARIRRYGLAVSHPCFELWALLLHRDQRAHIERGDVQHELAAIHPGYHHSRNPYLDLDTVLAGLEVAHERAEVLLEQAIRNGDPDGNPTTRFHHLVRKLEELQDD